MGQDQDGARVITPRNRRTQRENRRWKYFADPEYRANRLKVSQEYFRLWQSNPVYHEFINLGRQIARRRASIETHERIMERYQMELRKLEREVKRLEAKRAAKKGSVPRGKVGTAAHGS